MLRQPLTCWGWYYIYLLNISEYACQLINCFRAIFPKWFYLKKLNIYRKEQCELLFLICLIRSLPLQYDGGLCSAHLNMIGNIEQLVFDDGYLPMMTHYWRNSLCTLQVFARFSNACVDRSSFVTVLISTICWIWKSQLMSPSLCTCINNNYVPFFLPYSVTKTTGNQTRIWTIIWLSCRPVARPHISTCLKISAF